MDNETQERVIPASYKDYKADEDKAPEPAAEPKPTQESSADKREPEPDPAPAADKQPPEAKEVKSAPKGETAEAPEARKQEIQEKKEPAKRDRTAKGRVQELLAEGRLDEAEKILSAAAGKTHAEKVEALEKELQEFRTRKPAEPAKPEPAAKPAEDLRPSLKAITQKAAEGQEPYAGKEYEELQDMWAAELDGWNEREAERKVAARKAKSEADAAAKRQADEASDQQSRAKAYDASIEAAREDIPDYEQVIEACVAAYPNLANKGLGAGVGASKDPGRVRYELAKNGGAEYARIAQLPADEAFRETLWLDYRLSHPEAGKKPAHTLDAAPAPPERQPPAVSRAPKPYQPVSGFEDPVAARPSSYKQYKKQDDETARPRA